MHLNNTSPNEGSNRDVTLDLPTHPAGDGSMPTNGEVELKENGHLETHHIPQYKHGKWRIGTLIAPPLGLIPKDYEPYDNRSDLIKGATS